jgi:type II secretory pathway pseudopilin PulG
MLVVIAVIAVLTGLAVPAMRGMVGVSGVRGATNSLTSAFDQARFAAIENSTPTYLGFPPSSFSSTSNPNLRASSFIIFRERSPNEQTADPQFKALSRWITLPRGVFLDLSSAQLDSSIGSDAAPILPQLDGQNVAVDVIRFDKYGKVVSGSANMTIGVGSGVLDQSGSPVFPNPQEKQNFIIQRLTGRILPSTAVSK